MRTPTIARWQPQLIPGVTLSRLLHGIAVCLVMSSLSSCGTLEGSVPPEPSPASLHPHPNRHIAGAAEMDITPPPGSSMAGYSISAQTARGTWTRLKSKAFYFRDDQGNGLVMISCDLWGIPSGLHDRVAELLNSGATSHLRRDRILLAATHSHHAAGNYASSRFWNAFASHAAGFDRQVFSFLATRIAESVKRAVASAVPARWATGSIQVPGIAYNRSVHPYLLNPEVTRPNGTLAQDPSFSTQAVDSTLRVIQVSKQSDRSLIGALGFYAVHPTATGLKTQLYSADLFGTSCYFAKFDGTHALGSTAVVAMFNGAEGDVAANAKRRDRVSAVDLGRKLGHALSQLASQTTLRDVTGHIDSRFETIELPGQAFTEGHEHRSTAPKPMLGVATVGGALDGKTPLYATGYVEGIKGPRSEHHGPKQFALNFIGLEVLNELEPILELLLPARAYPRRAHLGAYQLGGLILGSLPGEFTTTMGARIRDSMARAHPESPDLPPLLVGCANSFLFYFTTPEEYEAQYYEGASTLYGPNSGPFVSRRLSSLAHQLHQDQPKCPSANSCRPYAYLTGTEHEISLDDFPPPTRAADTGLANIVTDALGIPARGFNRFVWTEARQPWPLRDPLAATVPFVAVGPATTTPNSAPNWDQIIQSNEGINFVTVLLSKTETEVTWASIWMQAPTGPTKNLTLEFRVLGLDGVYRRSKGFQLGDQPARIPELAPTP